MESKIEKILKPYPVIMEITIAWGDMDAFQHVNNTVYFKYFETVRIKYLEKINFMDCTKIGPILASIQCKFMAPLIYPDIITIGVKTMKMEDDRLIMDYCAVSSNLMKIAAKGSGVIVSYDYANGTKASVPEEVKQKVQKLEEKFNTD